MLLCPSCNTANFWKAVGLPHSDGSLPCMFVFVRVCVCIVSSLKEGRELLPAHVTGRLPLTCSCSKKSVNKDGNAPELPQLKENVPVSACQAAT